MSTPWSTARRRLGWAIAPAALAALTYSGSAAAATCVVPGDYVGYAESAGVPACLPNLELKKSGPPVSGPGVITWTITVFHRGYPDADDPYGSSEGIPVSAIHVSDIDTGQTDLVPNSVPADGLLRPGGSLSYTVKQKFDLKHCVKETLENTARFTLDGIEQTTTSDDVYTATTKVECTNDVAIVKTADAATYLPGGIVKWTIRVTNTGAYNVPVNRIKVDDPTATLTPESDPGPNGVLKPGQSLTFTASTPVTTENCTTAISNTATVALVGGGPVDANGENNSSTATVSCSTPAPNENGPGGTTGTPTVPPAPAQPGGSQGGPVCPRVTVGLAITAAKRPYAGQLSTVVLKVKARNDAKKVRLTYRLPSSFAVVAKSPGTTIRRGILVANLGSVNAGTTRTVRLSVRILRTAKGKRQHSATVTATCATTTRAALAANVRPLQGSVNPAVTG